MRKQELYHKIIAYFEEAMPIAETELHYKDPFQLLIAVILSAQCTDKRINMITPALFQDYPTPERWQIQLLKLFMNISAVYHTLTTKPNIW